MKRKLSPAIKAVICIFIALVIIILSYLGYIVFSYERVEDNLSLEIKGTVVATVPVNEELSAITYNIGFGAYSPDYSFFMDGGIHSRAFSKDAVIENTKGAIETVNEKNPDFVLIQEADVDGTRSYHVNQTELLANGFSDYSYTYAQNYDSAYFIYPFSEPIGANEAGIMTFSKFNIESALRRSLPIEESLYKYLDLDRAYSVARIETENGKTLVLYNVHLSAYTSDGTISDTQLKILGEDMKAEYDKGNFVVAGGDFNKDTLGDSSKYFKRTEGEFTWAKPLDMTLVPDVFSCFSGKNAPTCRNADSPFRDDGTDFVLSVDGFIVSDNVEVVSSETVDTGFSYSDHNPVIIKFILKD